VGTEICNESWRQKHLGRSFIGSFCSLPRFRDISSCSYLNEQVGIQRALQSCVHGLEQSREDAQGLQGHMDQFSLQVQMAFEKMIAEIEANQFHDYINRVSEVAGRFRSVKRMLQATISKEFFVVNGTSMIIGAIKRGEFLRIRSILTTLQQDQELESEELQRRQAAESLIDHDIKVTLTRVDGDRETIRKTGDELQRQQRDAKQRADALRSQAQHERCNLEPQTASWLMNAFACAAFVLLCVCFKDMDCGGAFCRWLLGSCMIVLMWYFVSEPTLWALCPQQLTERMLNESLTTVSDLDEKLRRLGPQTLHKLTELSVHLRTIVDKFKGRERSYKEIIDKVENLLTSLRAIRSHGRAKSTDMRSKHLAEALWTIQARTDAVVKQIGGSMQRLLAGGA